MNYPLSSPDPLNDSPTFQVPEKSPKKARRATHVRHSSAHTTSPSKQTFELDVGNQISSQKIRVTVEAGHSDAESGYTHYVEGAQGTGNSSSRRRVNRRCERTVTTIIPVKGLSDSEDEVQDATTPKRGRGRPRKSAGTPVPTKKSARVDTSTSRNGRKRKSIGDLVGGDDEADYDFQIGNGVQVGRGKGRSRSRSIKGTSRKRSPAAEDTRDTVVSETTKKGKGRRKSLPPDQVIALEKEKEESAKPEILEPDMDRDGSLQLTDEKRSCPQSAWSTIRSNATTVGNDPDVVIARFDAAIGTPRRTGWSSPQAIQLSHVSSPAFGYPSPSASPDKDRIGESDLLAAMSPQQYRASHDHEAEEENCEEGGEDELGEMREFDTILESEGFSMISVDSVPSLREQLSSPLNHENEPSTISRNSVVNYAKKSTTAEDDTFSSIPGDILRAATPARKAQIYRTTPEILEGSNPAGHIPKPKFLLPKNSPVYDDSFSAVPSAVLDAATPAPARHVLLPKLETSHKSTSSGRLKGFTLNRQTALDQNPSNLAATRLLTPEETPSPALDSSLPAKPAQPNSDHINFSYALVDRSAGNNSYINTQLRSSPPSIAPRRYTYNAHLRQRRDKNPDIAETPSIVFSPPSLPPPIHLARGQPVLTAQTVEIDRPGLSPIARAGRALQDAVGPTDSPRARALSLGSPFKSPAIDRKSSSSVAATNRSPSHARRANLHSGLNGGKRVSPTPRDILGQQDDPFSNNGQMNQGARSEAPKTFYTLGLPEKHRASFAPRAIRSEGTSELSDGAMSWQAEEEIAADDATTSRVNNINSSASYRRSTLEQNRIGSQENTSMSEQKWAAERDAVRRQAQSAAPSKVIVIECDEELSYRTQADEEDDDDFDLLLETLNSSSPETLEPEAPANDNSVNSRRSKLPSPWRKNSKRFSYNGGLSSFSSRPVPSNTSLRKGLANEDAGDEDNSLYLSSAILPENQNLHPRAKEIGDLDLSALLASSPNKSRPPVLTKRSPSITTIPKEPKDTGALTLRIDGSRSEPLEQPFAPIPEKLGFNPRLRDPSKSDSSSIFGSSPLKSTTICANMFGVRQSEDTVAHNQSPGISSSSSAPVPLGLSSPSRSNSLRISSPKDQSQVSEPGSNYDHSTFPTSEQENYNQSIDHRTLKWTDTIQLGVAQVPLLVSPTKSCLRSPLKTPSIGSRSGSSGANVSPSKNVAFVSSSPIPSSPAAEPLSATAWSRDHWVLLESILELWKPENHGGSEDGPNGRKRNSTRVISRLLGRKVYSRGEEMRLKQWHLEVVDEFRGYVPGWEERVIAMRVFALIVGAEQRRKGLLGDDCTKENE